MQRLAPKLLSTLERAIAFCEATLSHSKAQEKLPERQSLLIADVVNDVRETLALSSEEKIEWITALEPDMRIDADPEISFAFYSILPVTRAMLCIQQMARVKFALTGKREGMVSVIEVSDTGPGVPKKAKEHLFEAFQGSQNRRHWPWFSDCGGANKIACRRFKLDRGDDRSNISDYDTGPPLEMAKKRA